MDFTAILNVLNSLGGLALFLYAMGVMSDTLKSAAGDKFKSLLGKATGTPLKGVLTGASTTAIVQSSSATTVLVVGLITAGLLTLTQAISVILGANIGTTVTAWMVALVSGINAFKMAKFAYPILAIGFCLNVFSKKMRWKQVGIIFISLALIFIGLDAMQDAVSSLKDKNNSPFKKVIAEIGDNPIYAILAGMIGTVIIQSSSAFVAIVIIVANSGGFGDNPSEGLRVAIPFVMGGNIGTTITAQLAAFKSNLAGRRAAMAHTMFNVIGVCLIIPFLYLGWYADLIERITPWRLEPGTLKFFIAMAHTVFNVSASAIMLPFVNQLAGLVVRVLPQKDSESELPTVTLETHLLESPPLALRQVRAEMVKMLEVARRGLNKAVRVLRENDTKLVGKVHAAEEAVDDFQASITNYLVELSKKSPDKEVSDELPILLHNVNDIERLGDHAVNITEIANRKIEANIDFGEAASAEIDRMERKVFKMYDYVINAIKNNDKQSANNAIRTEGVINEIDRELKNNHISRLSKGECQFVNGLIFMDYLQNLEKIGDHLANVAQGVASGTHWDSNFHGSEPNT